MCFTLFKNHKNPNDQFKTIVSVKRFLKNFLVKSSMFIWTCSNIWFLLSQRTEIHKRLSILKSIALSRSHNFRTCLNFKIFLSCFSSKCRGSTYRIIDLTCFSHDLNLPLSSSFGNLGLTKKSLRILLFWEPVNSTLGNNSLCSLLGVKNKFSSSICT